jgi:integrase
MSKSTVSARSGKPTGWEKPYADFPLSYHPPSGRVYKKIRGKRVYFSYARDWQAAVSLYLVQRDALQAGLTPRKSADGLTLKTLCNDFLNEKRRLLEAGEITARTIGEYFSTANRFIEAFGSNRVVQDLTAEDFSRLRSMVLLAVNCGYGQTDVASLRTDHLDLDGGWATFPRPKTGAARTSPLSNT